MNATIKWDVLKLIVNCSFQSQFYFHVNLKFAFLKLPRLGTLHYWNERKNERKGSQKHEIYFVNSMQLFCCERERTVILLPLQCFKDDIGDVCSILSNKTYFFLASIAFFDKQKLVLNWNKVQCQCREKKARENMTSFLTSDDANLTSSRTMWHLTFWPLYKWLLMDLIFLPLDGVDFLKDEMTDLTESLLSSRN